MRIISKRMRLGEVVTKNLLGYVNNLNDRNILEKFNCFGYLWIKIISQLYRCLRNPSNSEKKKKCLGGSQLESHCFRERAWEV